MTFPRTSGVLLHPTSFPSPYGIGDLGPGARGFIDFLAASRQQIWQVLPLGTPGYGNSPYLAYSAIAVSPLLISPEGLKAAHLLQDSDVEALPNFEAHKADFEGASQVKMPLFRRAFTRFLAGEGRPIRPEPGPNHSHDSGQHSGHDSDHEPAQTEPHVLATIEQDFAEFCDRSAHWLDDYALFMAIKADHEGLSWHQWPAPLASRSPEALAEVRSRLAGEVEFQRFLQFLVAAQWRALKTYANDRGISIIGDIPIYVAHDSADVWANPENFCLNPETYEPAQMAGVPPDYFSETGQLWGNPVYNWDHLQTTNFSWWIERFEALLDWMDVIRIDHFRGFESYWSVPEGETTAMNGTWIQAPGHALFEAVQAKLGSLPIVAEDLGIITPEVEALRDRFEFPGMKILQFAFGSGPGNPYLPFNFWGRNWVIYTGTHDNDTTMGWFTNSSQNDQDHICNFVGNDDRTNLHWHLIRLALMSLANQAIVPLQDLLGLGSDARMNFPGTATGNWDWRYEAAELTEPIAQQMASITEISGRAS
jgi:4-alpha-glucanotransferase